MPPIGLALGGVDFSNLFLVLGEGSYESLDAAKEAGAATINSLKKKEEAKAVEPPKPSAEVTLLTEIRDMMAKQ
jgi:large conductance mechanosensitive channel